MNQKRGEIQFYIIIIIDRDENTLHDSHKW